MLSSWLVITAALLTTTSQVAGKLRENLGVYTPFSLEGRVTFPCQRLSKAFALDDGSDPVVLVDNVLWPTNCARAGDLLRITGHVESNQDGCDKAICTGIRLLEHGQAPTPPLTEVTELLKPESHYRTVRFRGTVREAFRDEIDPDWRYAAIRHNGRSAYAVFQSDCSDRCLDGLIDSEVEITALNLPPERSGNRKLAGPILLIHDETAFRFLRRASADPFSTPELGDTLGIYSEAIADMGRRRVRGRVIAVRREGLCFLLTRDSHLIGFEPAGGERPRYAETVEVVGFPETDFYRINLAGAVWRSLPDDGIREPAPASVTVREILSSGRSSKIETEYHGSAIRLRGTIGKNDDDGHLTLDNDGRTVPVDATALPDIISALVPGTEIELTGICVLECDNWRNGALFPRIRGLTIIPRTAADIRILSTPSWWTTTRLLIVIGVMLLVIFAVIIWNQLLRTMVLKYSRRLADETLARSISEMKVSERTRLSVELHDTLAQNLTGATMEIRTAKRTSSEGVKEMNAHLDLALKTLDSCRQELRNCIWDLRSNALETDSMNEAILQTLRMLVDTTRVTVRFAVPREQISDDAAHALLRIIRELVLNAFRHGGADSVRVAGSIEGNLLRFSVRDDGSGFDPDAVQGAEQGHFGLSGIRERVSRFNGTMDVCSGGAGTKVTISLLLPSIERKST